MSSPGHAPVTQLPPTRPHLLRVPSPPCALNGEEAFNLWTLDIAEQSTAHGLLPSVSPTPCTPLHCTSLRFLPLDLGSD